MEGFVRRKPNFFFVGAAKSGTTALSDYLGQHPDIFMAAKEPHYFADDLQAPRDPEGKLQRYARFFEKAGSEKIVGDASVFYLYSETAAKKIFEYDPGAKILIQIRNPIEVLPSHYSQLVFVGGESAGSFEEALDLEAERAEGRNVPDFIFQKTSLYSRFVLFTEQIERYLDVFPQDQVQINLFDDFKSDTMSVYRRTLEFLEVDPEFVPEIEVVNANKTMRSKWVMDTFVRNPPNWVSTTANILFPPGVRDRIKNAIKRVNTNYHARQPLDAPLRLRLARETQPEIDRLGRLLGRDLRHWYSDILQPKGDTK